MKSSKRSWWGNPRVVLVIIGSSLLLGACKQSVDATHASEAPPSVRVDVVDAQTHKVAVEMAGRVNAVRTAEVGARATGLVEKRLFTEGANVKAGQILYQIDQAPLKAALAEARGALAGASAALTVASDVVTRYRPLLEQDAVSHMTFAHADADRKKAAAARDAALAAVKAAQLNLSYATVRAPISGRIGYALVNEGALVSAAQATPLALIQSIDSVYVDLTQPASSARSMAVAAQKDAKPTALAVTVQIADAGAVQALAADDKSGDNDAPNAASAAADAAMHGTFMFEDISVDPGTGQVRSRALMPNPAHRLLPGMYVRAWVTTGYDEHALFVDQKALRFASDGTVKLQEVDEDDQVRVRTVVLGDMKGGKWQVKRGLKPGAKVVSAYADKLRDGTKVQANAGRESGEQARDAVSM